MDANALALLFLSFVPTFETRYVIPLAVADGYSPLTIFIGATAATVMLALILAHGLWVLERIVLRIPFLKKIWDASVVRARSKSQIYVDKYGAPGIIIFVAIPLPGTGVWTGSLVGYLLGVNRWKLALYTSIGGIIANTIMLLASMGLFSLIP